MRILLDENVPVQTLVLLSRTLPGHLIEHVESIGWKGKKDKFLLPDAVQAGYDMLVTNDSNQLSDPEESRLIRRSRIHHVTFKQAAGLRGFSAAVASIIVAMPSVVAELEQATGQRLVHITGINADKKRHTTTDPSVNPPPYWN